MASKKSGGGAVRALVFLGLAVVAGASAILVLYQVINSYQEQIDKAIQPEDKVMAIVAARDLYQGITITEEDLFGVEIPPRFLPEGVFLSPEFVVGRIPRERILANEFVRNDRLADPESGVGLNAVIPRGMRAISINVSNGRALSGFLNPKNYVDVLVTVLDDGRKRRSRKRGSNKGSDKPKVTTKTLFQAVFVLGVDSRMGEETVEEARGQRKLVPSVTLLVTAEQAEDLAHAQDTGQITLVLRNTEDVNYTATTGVDLNALLGRFDKPEVKRKVLKKKAVVVKPTTVLKFIRGTEIENKKIE